jgi:hypothetical protein
MTGGVAGNLWIGVVPLTPDPSPSGRGECPYRCAIAPVSRSISATIVSTAVQWGM